MVSLPCADRFSCSMLSGIHAPRPAPRTPKPQAAQRSELASEVYELTGLGLSSAGEGFGTSVGVVAAC